MGEDEVIKGFWILLEEAYPPAAIITIVLLLAAIYFMVRYFLMVGSGKDGMLKDKDIIIKEKDERLEKISDTSIEVFTKVQNSLTWIEGHQSSLSKLETQITYAIDLIKNKTDGTG